jgi:hypothetical protein
VRLEAALYSRSAMSVGAEGTVVLKKHPAESVASLVQFPKNVEELPLVNAKLNTVNLYLNWISTWRTNYLLRNVSDLNELMKVGAEKLEEIEANVSGLNSKMDKETEELRSSLVELKAELEAQQQVIQTRERELDRFKMTQFNRDGIIDATSFALTYLFVYSPLVNWPLQSLLFVVYSIPGLNRVLLEKKHASSGTHLFLIYWIFSSFRRFCIEKEFHSQKGNAGTYIAWAATKLRAFVQFGLRSSR